MKIVRYWLARPGVYRVDVETGVLNPDTNSSIHEWEIAAPAPREDEHGKIVPFTDTEIETALAAKIGEAYAAAKANAE